MTIEETKAEGEAIATKISQLLSFLPEMKPDEAATAAVSVGLLGGLLTDINRIANALETLATPVVSEAREVPSESDAWLFNMQSSPDYKYVDIKFNDDTFAYRVPPNVYNWVNSGNPKHIRHWRPSL